MRRDVVKPRGPGVGSFHLRQNHVRLAEVRDGRHLAGPGRLRSLVWLSREEAPAISSVSYLEPAPMNMEADTAMVWGMAEVNTVSPLPNIVL